MFDLFMCIDGIAGESQDARHRDWIELRFLLHRIQGPPSTDSVAAVEGKPERPLGEYKVEKWIDRSSPKLYEACCSGRLIPEITIEICRAGADQVRFLEIKLEEVV